MLTEFLKSINETKVNLMRENPETVTAYPAFIVRRLLSYHDDCILLVNEINCIPNLDPQLEYEFLLHALSRRKRFAKLHKVEKPERLDIVKRFYGYSDAKAMEVLSLHTEDDFTRMENALRTGGVK